MSLLHPPHTPQYLTKHHILAISIFKSLHPTYANYWFPVDESELHGNEFAVPLPRVPEAEISDEDTSDEEFSLTHAETQSLDQDAEFSDASDEDFDAWMSTERQNERAFLQQMARRNEVSFLGGTRVLQDPFSVHVEPPTGPMLLGFPPTVESLRISALIQQFVRAGRDEGGEEETEETAPQNSDTMQHDTDTRQPTQSQSHPHITPTTTSFPHNNTPPQHDEASPMHTTPTHRIGGSENPPQFPPTLSYLRDSILHFNNKSCFALFREALHPHLKSMQREVPSLDSIFSEESIYKLPFSNHNTPLLSRHSRKQMQAALEFLHLYTALDVELQIIQNVQYELVYNERIKDAAHFDDMNIVFEYYNVHVDRNPHPHFSPILQQELTLSPTEPSSQLKKLVSISTLAQQAFLYLYFSDTDNYRLFNAFLDSFKKHARREWVEEVLLKIYALQLFTGILTDAQCKHVQLLFLVLLEQRWTLFSRTEDHVALLEFFRHQLVRDVDAQR